MAATAAHPPGQQLDMLARWIDGIDLPMFILRRCRDERLEYVHANSAFGRVTGIDQTRFAKHSADEIFPVRMAAQLAENFHACLRGEEPVAYEDCLMVNGEESWWQTTLSKPDGFEDRVILGLAVPVTDAKRRELASAHAVAEMAARFDDLQLFSTIAAHDARSPLATVAGLVDLLLDDADDIGDGKRELLRLVGNTVDEALIQISDTLERSRNHKGQVSHRTNVDIGRLTNDIAVMVDPENLFDIEIPAAKAECDAVVLQMGLRNLMSNAARFALSRVSVRVDEDRTRGLLFLGVADDGHGLPSGTRLKDLVDAGAGRRGTHGFGLRSITQVLRSRGGDLRLRPPLAHDGLTGAHFQIALPGRLLTGCDGAEQGGRFAVAS